MNTLLLSLILAFGAPVTGDPTEEAEVLYREGTVKYEAADYNGAIEDFTAALALVVEAPDTEDNRRTRLTILYNIAATHEKAFTIDQDITHLRQAIALYERYLKFAQSTGDLGDEIDAEAKLAHLRKQIRVHKQIEENRANSSKQPPPAAPSPSPTDEGLDWERPRKTGIALVGAGGVLTLGGVALAVVGSQLEPRAEQEVSKLADLGVPMDHPSWEQGDEFIAQEKRKGNALLGVGVSVAVVGAVGVGVGSYYLVKAKRLRENEVAVIPSLSPNFAGIQLSGKF